MINRPLAFSPIHDPLINSPFFGSNQFTAYSPAPPDDGFFLLLDGTDFLLLDTTNFLLL